MKKENAPKLLEALEDGIYIIKKDYTIEYMNTAMMNLFGDGIGGKCYEVINRRDTPCQWCNYENVFHHKETHSEEVYIEWLDRSFKVIEIPVDNRDGTTSKLSIYKDITRKKEQEAKLKSSKEDYRRLFENVGCGVFQSSREGRFLDVNPALLKMLGYNDKEEFLALDLATDLYLRPEDRQRYMEIIEEKGRVLDYEMEWKRKDGSIMQVLLTGHIRCGAHGQVLGYEGIVVDQSHRKRMENKMKEAYDFLDKTILCSPNAIMATDLKGDVIIWNQGAEEIFDY
ncbi:MAG: PAS domain-containing protein, partial [Desulfarculaceae bacterium]|nr:PAS domain-containing protein [Desulfarculaceae bacterium]